MDRFPVFTATSDWDTAQTVTVTADEDADDQDETHRISHQTSSVDGDYHNLMVDEVVVTVTDDEGTGSPGGTLELTVSTTQLRITEGNSGSYTVVLNAQPPEAVMVAVAAPAGGDLTVNPSLLEFTVSNWDRPQEVTVTAGEDADLLDEVESITHTVTLASEAVSRRFVGGRSTFAFSAVPVLAREYVYLGGQLLAIDPGASVSSVASVVVTIEDNDDAAEVGIPTSTPHLVLTEGNSGSYTVELGSEPSAEVTISPRADPGTDVTVAPASLTFKPTDPANPSDPARWDKPRRVTVTAAQDADADDEREVIRHDVTSADANYAGIADITVTVSIRDDDEEDGLVGPDPVTGVLMASPNPCFIAMGQTECTFTLSWTLSNTETIQVQDENGMVILESGGVGDTVTQSLGETPAFAYHMYDYTNNVLGDQSLSSVVVSVVPEPPGPKITSVSPDSGEVTRWVTIAGMRFGATQGGSTVAFNGTPVSSGGIISWSDTVVEVRVPAGATSGLVVVTVGQIPSNGVPFTVRPTLTCQAWPYDIKVGGSSTLSWTTAGATGVTIERTDEHGTVHTVFTAGGGQVASGSHVVTPAATTDYSLKATGPDGQATYCTGRVTLWEAPVIEVFRADPESIDQGEVTRLSWGTAHATSVEIDQGIGYVSVVDGGNVDVAPAQTTTYTLTATNRAWSGGDGVTDQVQVTVNRTQGGPTISCSPASSDLFRGHSETLRWDTTGATGLTIEDGDGNTIFTASATEVASGTHAVTPDKPTTYRLTATDQSGGTASCPSTLTPWDAPVISLTATPSVIVRGASSKLEWHVANATEVSFVHGYRDPRTGEIRYVETREPRYVPLSGTRVVTPGETSGYTLTATNPMYDVFNAVQAHVEVTVTSGPPPITCSVSPADIQLVQPGASTTLKWETTGNISSVSISPDPGGGAPGTNGMRVVTPVSTTEYTFTATDQGGQSYQCSAGVTVWDQPEVSRFTATPDSISSGEKTTVEWSTRHATSVSISPNPGGGTPGASGSREVSPSADTTYTLTASNPAWTGGGAVSATAPVAVGGLPGGPRIRCSASPTDICSGGSSTLSWQTTDADSVNIDQGIGSVTPVAGGTETVYPTTTTTYKLTATNTVGSATCSVTVNVWDPPTASISANRTTINEGQPFTLSWTTANAGSASIDQGVGIVTANVSGSRTLTPSEGTHTYTITASKATGSPCSDATDSVTVTVRPKPPGSISASPNPCKILPGSNTCTSTISWSATGTNGTLVEVDHLIRAFATSGATGSQDAPWIQEAPQHSYTFELYDYNDRIKGALLDSVVVTGTRPGVPTCDSFTASPADICSGGTSRLTWTSSDATSAELDPGGISVDPNDHRDVSPSSDTEYTLTVTGAGGSAMCKTTVDVWDPPTAGISANRTTINEGQPFTLSWTTANAGSASIDQGVGSVTANVSGSRTLTPSEGTHTYTITASKATGSPCSAATDSVTVTVRPKPPGDITASPNPCKIESGDDDCTTHPHLERDGDHWAPGTGVAGRATLKGPVQQRGFGQYLALVD